MISYDTGPANYLIDLWCREKFDIEYDLDGGLASMGDVDTKLLNPSETWSSKDDYDSAAKELAAKFKENIDKFDISDEIRQAGPII